MFRSFSITLLGAAVVCRTATAETSPTKQTIQVIRQLGRTNEMSLPDLAGYLNNPDRDIRIEAVKAIVRIDTMRSLDPLVKASQDNDSEIQIRAIDGMVNAYVPGFVTRNSVTGYLTRGVRQIKSIFASRNDTVVDPDVKVKDNVAEALSAKITGGNGMDVRSDAALAAGILRAKASVPALETGLKSKDSDLIFECLVALQKINDPAAGDSVDLLVHDLEERIQITALDTLGQLHTLTAADDIRAVFKSARNVKVQRAALSSLAALGLGGDRALFLQNVDSTDPEIRVSALEGLGRIREPADYPKLESAFNQPDTDWRVHEAAAFAMVMQGDNNVDVLGPLNFLIEGFSLRQRADVSHDYLAEVAQREQTRAVLSKMLPELSKDRKIGVFDVLGLAGTPDAIQILQPYTTDSDRDIANAAKRAIRIAKARSATA